MTPEFGIALNAVLKPAGFRRSGRSWTRVSGSFVDWVGLQIAKSGDVVTTNLGIHDPELNRIISIREPSIQVNELDCAVRTRLNAIVPEHAGWWAVPDPEAAADMAGAMAVNGLRWLDGMRSRSAIAQHLTSENVETKPYPLPILVLAVLRRLEGDAAESERLFAGLRSRELGPWTRRIDLAESRLRSLPRD